MLLGFTNYKVLLRSNLRPAYVVDGDLVFFAKEEVPLHPQKIERIAWMVCTYWNGWRVVHFSAPEAALKRRDCLLIGG